MSFDPVLILNQRFSAAIAAAFPDHAGADPLIAPGKNPKFGDFQCNAAMSVGKAVGKPPREVAQAIVKHLDVADIAEPVTEASIAGPGFINILLRTDALAGLLGKMDTPLLGIEPAAGKDKQTIVVDLCGVNLAKQMHVGHLRAVIIGDAVARVFERLGHKVVRQNHVGDWGLPIAMVTAKLMQLEATGKDLTNLDLDTLEKLYKAAQKECAADERGLAMVHKYNLGPKAEAEIGAQVAEAREHMAAAKATLVKLQAHDPATYKVWKRIADITMKACLATCARLGANVTEEHSAGESSYSEELAPLVDELIAKGITEVSDGALVIRVEGFDEPCIIRKSDGGFLYATTDIAGVRRRVQKFGAQRVVYCVDARQGLHFKLVYGAAHRAGYDIVRGSNPPVAASLEHAAFGMVCGADGKPYKTRSGENVKLWELLDEAALRALAVVNEKNPELPEQERRAIAEVVGVAAIKYVDLSNDRAKDYVFDFDRMIAFEGNTGPYLLFAAARIRNIFAKAEKEGIKFNPAAPIILGVKEEKDLALTILRYAGAVRAVASSNEPHKLCGFLYDLAGAYSSFYTNCHVLNAPDEPTRQSRLRLCRLAGRVLEDGLALLGITALERM